MSNPADQHLYEARRAIDSAAKDLAAVVIEKCSGYEDFRTDAVARYRQAMNLILDARDLLEDH